MYESVKIRKINLALVFHVLLNAQNLTISRCCFVDNGNGMLYLPTQIRFSIRGEGVTRHGLKLNNSLGKQQLNLSTRT